ncbi:unnamed protein product [Kluyveromyces dobzhanskii CBS 2104]|uniref:WGS project CCBQ000000000 data, contig 00043 n=1 Tax=Kluyveromyces dobzhanskii CBS 2104 TaxID=1427455 RepID=A0A0A8L4X6_9SACH|nr:unnamed protein product [Kluyveromyces dobzhanskii CBS 2104]
MSIISPPVSPGEAVASQPSKERHSRTVIPLNLTKDVERASKCLDKAFADSPANDYLMKKFFNVSVREPCSKARVNSMLKYFLHLYDDFGAEIVEANGFDAVAVWTTPKSHFHQNETNDAKFNDIFFTNLGRVTKSLIPEGVDYYYLFIIGKDLTHPEIRGSVRAIFDAYKKRADAENCAMVLEAISEKAKSVYEYFGFKNYLDFSFGQNEVDSNGNYDPNGEGFNAHLMIYYKNEIPGAI